MTTVPGTDPTPSPAAPEPVERPRLVHWAAVLAGAAVGFAAFFIVSALWFALAGTAGTNFFAHNLAWFLLGDALFAALVAGYVGGLVGRLRHLVSGMITGFTVWGLLMFIAILLRMPELTGIFRVSATGAGETARFLSSSALWATFGAFIGGFFLAGVAGAAGAESRRTPDYRWRVRAPIARHPTRPPEA